MTQTQFNSTRTLIRCMFRMVEQADSPRLCAGYAHTDTASLRENMLAHSRLPDPAVALLAEMDRKLDALLGLMRQEQLHDDFPLEGKVVEISGAGLTLECKHPLAPGDFMELLLMLDDAPVHICSVLAKVERISKTPPETGPPNTPFILSYSSLYEEDREAIIRFVFKEERRRIRMSKGGE